MFIGILHYFQSIRSFKCVVLISSLAFLFLDDFKCIWGFEGIVVRLVVVLGFKCILKLFFLFFNFVFLLGGILKCVTSQLDPSIIPSQSIVFRCVFSFLQLLFGFLRLLAHFYISCLLVLLHHKQLVLQCNWLFFFMAFELLYHELLNSLSSIRQCE